MTRLQAIVRKAGVSEQAAWVWQKASEIEEAVVATYIAEAKAASHEITLNGLLAWAKSPDGGGGGGGNGGGGNGSGNGGGGDDDDDPPTHACPLCGLMHVALSERSEE